MDLKATKMVPSSKARPDHIRQVGWYASVREKPGMILYVSGQKIRSFDISDDMAKDAAEEYELTAASLEKFLAKMDSPEEALGCLPYDKSHWKLRG